MSRETFTDRENSCVVSNSGHVNTSYFIFIVYSSLPALQLLHGRTQVAGCHHVYLPLDAVFSNEWVKSVWQHAEEQWEEERLEQDSENSSLAGLRGRQQTSNIIVTDLNH